jgi:site-specific recombinase XerD
MLEDMAARKLNPHTQRSHVYSCKRFAAWLKRSPDTATPDEVRRFQLYLIESGASICNRNRIMTGVRFLFRVTLRRHDLAAEVWHIKEPQKLPPVLSPEEVKRVLTMAPSLKARAMLTLAYGCGLRASEVVRLRAGDIDLHRTCPHCGGKNTSYFIGIEESVWFTTKYETANGLVLFACSDTSRHKCPNLPKPEPAVAQHDNDTGGDALTP